MTDWATDQLDRSGLPRSTRACVMKLLEAWSTVSPSTAVEQKSALSAFSELAQHHPIVNDPAWMEGRPGRFVMRDRVRVKHDAYEGAAGDTHNGREGIIVAIRSGDILVTYDDGGEAYTGVRHSPYKLEKRVL